MEKAMNHRYLLISISIFTLALGASSAEESRSTPLNAAEEIDFKPELWQVKKNGMLASDYRGVKGVRLNLRGYKGAFLKDYDFENGIIEVDMAASGKGFDFPGIIFRAEDDKKYECVYFRPSSSTSKKRPVSAYGAFQYFPAYAGEDSFRMYGAPEYEAQGELPRDGSWFHVRIEVSGPAMRVFVNHGKDPAFVVKRLLRINTRGTIGLWSFGRAYFANLKVTKTPPSKEKIEERQPAKEYISLWRVSKGFMIDRGERFEKLLNSKAKEDKTGWKQVSTDHNGLLDFFRFVGRSTTVFASASIYSEKDQTKELLFDHAIGCKMFLRGRQIYTGKNMRLRDGRKKVKLALQRGENELFVAVTRPSVDIFGLGFIARMGDLQGIRINRRE
jgi:hypothetical protein